MIELRPPDELLTPCRQPQSSTIETNGGLLDLLIVTVDAFNRCAARVDAIRKFYRGE